MIMSEFLVQTEGFLVRVSLHDDGTFSWHRSSWHDDSGKMEPFIPSRETLNTVKVFLQNFHDNF